MKMFDKAVLKLAGIYTVILLMVSVGFSVACYMVADRELSRPLHTVDGVVGINAWHSNNDEILLIINQRDEEIRNRFLVELVFINLGIVLSGAVISYFLARRTLRPIAEDSDRQANFVSDASHELKTPLAAIQMENEVLLRDKSAGKDELRAGLKSNLEEIGKLKDLTERLLKLSQNEKVELSDFNIIDVVNSAVDRSEKTAGSKDIVIQNTVQPRQIHANPEVLTEILSILIDNAIKYSPSKSTVTIGEKNDKIFVADQGPGIDEKDLSNIFDRFYRAEKSRTSDGFGLGLSLAQNLANKLHTRVAVDNIKKGGKTCGAMFTIKL